MDDVGMVVVVVFVLVTVVAIAYRVGSLWARRESQKRDQVIEAQWRILAMDAPLLPRWRRLAGWAAYTLSALLLGLFLALAYRNASSWGWTDLIAAWFLWFAFFLGVLGIAEWCWKPSRDAQPGASEEHPE
jgi:hypothetical protein